MRRVYSLHRSGLRSAISFLRAPTLAVTVYGFLLAILTVFFLCTIRVPMSFLWAADPGASGWSALDCLTFANILWAVWLLADLVALARSRERPRKSQFGGLVLGLALICGIQFGVSRLQDIALEWQTQHAQQETAK